MTDARKAAEAAVKTAERAYESSAKKADAALEKAKELNAERNRAARALNHALANPDLFDDDPLSVVHIGPGIPQAAPGHAVTFSGHVPDSREVVRAIEQNTQATIAAAGIKPSKQPAAAPAYAAVAITAEEAKFDLPVPPADDPRVGPEAPPADDDTPPWQAPPATAPKTRRVGQRRTAAAKTEPEAAPPVEQPAPPVQQPATPQFLPDGTPVEDPFNVADVGGDIAQTEPTSDVPYDPFA
jgi:hypothetical protein